MATNVTYNNVVYSLPQAGDTNWGNSLQALLQALLTSSNKVVAVYSSGAGQAIANNAAAAIVNFDTMVVDTHSAVTTGASWHFTAPVAGLYNVSASIQVGATVSTAISTKLDAYVNGSLVSRLQAMDTTTSSDGKPGLSGSQIVVLAAGDTLDVRVTQISGSSRNLSTNATSVRVSINRV